MFATTGTVVHIGPTQAVKSLDAAKWPSKGQSVTFLVDASPTPYKLSHHGVFGNVTIEPSDPSKRPTFQLQGTNYPTIYSNGMVTIKNINTIGGSKIILTGSNPHGSLDVENVKMLDGGSVWNGQGVNSAYFKDNEVYGVPYDYVYANFTGVANKVVIDNSGTKVPVQQGSKEAAIRFMNVNDLTLKGVITKPHYGSGGRILKQDVQLRPSSRSFKIINCHFGIIDIGDMTWRKPALPVQNVTITDSILDKGVHITSGVGTVRIINTKVAGSIWNKTL